MGSEQSAPLPHTTAQAAQAAEQSAAQSNQPSLFTRMLDPYANVPYGDEPQPDTKQRGTHSRNSSMSAPPGASASHVSLSLDMLGDHTPAEREEHSNDYAPDLVEGALSRIAPPSVAAMLSRESPAQQHSVF